VWVSAGEPMSAPLVDVRGRSEGWEWWEGWFLDCERRRDSSLAAVVADVVAAAAEAVAAAVV
jgi:hypothetical protein